MNAYLDECSTWGDLVSARCGNSRQASKHRPCRADRTWGCRNRPFWGCDFRAPAPLFGHFACFGRFGCFWALFGAPKNSSESTTFGPRAALGRFWGAQNLSFAPFFAHKSAKPERQHTLFEQKRAFGPFWPTNSGIKKYNST